MGGSALEVNDFMGIEGFAQEAGFEVEVWASGAAGGASEADGLPSKYDLILRH